MAGALTDIDSAEQIVLATARPLGGEPVALANALGRVLAEEVRALQAVPPFDNSAMDGFAVRCADVAGASERQPVILSLVGESRAGHPAVAALASGEAIAISTGAVLPQGADAVVRIEDTRPGSNGSVQVLTGVKPGAEVRRAGEDIQAGAAVLSGGTRLGAAQLGVLASAGCAYPVCFRRPRVAVLTTGDELAGPEQELGEGMVRNANAFTIPALAQRVGAEVVSVQSVPDTAADTSQAIAVVLHNDVVVVCGGVSVGEHDHVKASLAGLGAQEYFHGVALKPGKPMWFGQHGQTLVFGLPGNPVSAMVTFLLFAAPALRKLGGAPESQRRLTATLTGPYEKRPGRAHAVRCKLKMGTSGWEVQPAADQGSHVLSSMLDADALAILPSEQGSVQAGERVEVVSVREMLGAIL